MTAITPIRTAAETALSAAMAGVDPARPGAGLRAAAAARFGAAGLPHRRIEAYHYTDLRALLRGPVPAPAPAPQDGSAPQSLLPGLRPRVLAVIDGHAATAFADASTSNPGASIPGVTITALATVLAEGAGTEIDLASQADDAVVTLNSAFLDEGVVVRVAAGVHVEDTIELAHEIRATSPVMTALRHRIELGAGAKLRVIETHRSAAGLAHLANTVIEVVLGEGAELTLLKVQAEGDKAVHFGTLTARLGSGANLNHFVLTEGAALSRHQVFARFDGRAARLATRGVTLLRGRQHGDTTLVIEHAEPEGESRELYKSAIDGEAKGVFQGKIVVEPKAQRTDGRMASHAILLSDGAEIANKPELEIFADDVQCGHGATAGALDERLKFYLMARGIPEAEAERLLVLAFLAEPVEELGEPDLGDAITARIEAWLAARASKG